MLKWRLLLLRPDDDLHQVAETRDRRYLLPLRYYSGGSYRGFDRFGRVVDHTWYDYGASTNRDEFTYGCDRASNRLYRENTSVSSQDDYYTYGDVNRL